MRYIRTKYGIYERKKYPRKLNDAGVEVFVINVDKGQDETIISQADTIEELCDLYVMVHLDCECTPAIFANKIPLQCGYTINKDYIFYGAIWTDKGLIYVAKMNEKGDLELL